MDLYNNSKFDDSRLSENYKVIISKNYSEARLVISKWAEGFIDRDNKFVDEFQTTFNSSFWELYCFAVIKELGLKVDFNHEAPDFVITSNENIKFMIECTITNPPEKGLLEYDRYEKIYHTMSMEDSVDLSTIRLLNSLHSKWKWIKKNETKIPFLNSHPFILAIAPFDQPNFQIPNLQAIRRVLYGLDRRVFLKGEYYDFFKDEVIKENGEPLPLGVFTNDDRKEISGVMFSCVATLSKVNALSKVQDIAFLQNRYNEETVQSMLSVNLRIKYKNINEYRYKRNEIEKRVMAYEQFINTDTSKYTRREPFIQMGYQEGLTDGLYLFLNPYAKNKLNENFIKSFIDSGINVVTFDLKNGTEEAIEVHDGSLLQRHSIRFNFRG